MKTALKAISLVFAAIGSAIISSEALKKVNEAKRRKEVIDNTINKANRIRNEVPNEEDI